MSDIKDGGPAFPVPPDVMNSDGVMAIPSQAQPGMSLRDYFAAKTLVVLPKFWMDCSAIDDAEKTAAQAYRIADAMLAERAKGTK